MFTLPTQLYLAPPSASADGHEVLFAGRKADASANDAASYKMWISMHPISQTSELEILAGSRDVKMITSILRNQLNHRVRGGLNGGSDEEEEFAVGAKVRKIDEDKHEGKHDDGDDQHDDGDGDGDGDE